MSQWQRALGERGVQAAVGGLVVSLVLLTWAANRAWRMEEIAPRAGAVALSRDALIRVPDAGDLDLRRAAAGDLFTPERTAPPERYRLPGEAAPPVAVTVTAPSLPIVLGTAIAGDGKSFATCQFESSRLLMVRVGDHVGPYLVKSIARGSVEFQTPTGERLEILALRPGS